MRQVAVTSRDEQITRFERSKETVAPTFVGPLSRPQLHRFSAVNAFGGQNAANLPVINFSLFEDEQRQIVRMVLGHPGLTRAMTPAAQMPYGPLAASAKRYSSLMAS